MATMGFQLYDGDAQVVTGLESSGTQTFVSGELVIISGGYIAIATTSSDLYGVALTKASGTAATKIQVIPLRPEQRWLAQATGTTALTNQGVAYDCDFTAGAMGVNPSGTTVGAFFVEALDPRDGAHTGAGGRVIGRFVYASCDAVGG